MPVLARFGDGYMITVRTKSSLNIKEVVRFFNRNFPEAVLKVGKDRKLSNVGCLDLPRGGRGSVISVR